MKQHVWKDNALCLGLDTNIFFEKYEDDTDSRTMVDSLCATCPVARQCFAVGVSGKEWGVWGGVYIESGEISRDLNKHKSKEDWSNTWKKLTMD
jgi:hypothetical protein